METITLTEAHAVVWIQNEDGSETIVNMLPITALRTPLHCMKGRKGADILWAAHKEAEITEDLRYES